jgi:sulfur relay (sulfurtransferase) complex TusBCD TusD component (DsrE family)
MLNAGHEVEIFIMDDGDYNVVSAHKIAPEFAELLDKGAKIGLCAHTAEDRGIKESDCIKGVNFAGQYELATLVNEADRFLSFGG